MNDFAKELGERISDWPDEAIAELMQAIIDIEVKHFGVCRLSDDERAAVREGLAQAERGEFVSDKDVAAVLRRFRS
jgi:predicted transcriptional regulator